MFTGLLFIFILVVCAALIGVVLLQRSEGGAFGMGGGPTGLITTRGAGDLLTRSTWVLFAIFVGLSLSLTLLGSHEHANSSLLERMKGEIVNPNALNRPAPATNAPTPDAGQAPAAPGGPVNPFMAPAPAAAPAPAGTPVPVPAGAARAPAPVPAAAARTAAARNQIERATANPGAVAAPSFGGAPAEPAPAAPAPAAAAPAPAPATLDIPPPSRPNTAAPSSAPAPHADPNAPVSTGAP